MINCFLGSQPLLDPVEETANLHSLGRAIPPEMARCNSLANPLGRDPARAWVLLSRVSLNILGLNSLLTLTLADGLARPNKLVIPNLVVTRDPLGLTAGITANDPTSAYLVELADARWRVANPSFSVPVIAQFNVRAPAFSTAAVPYYAGSTNSGTPWTWLTLVQNLWGLMSTWLGSAPGSLPFTPNGTPEGFVFLGVPAWHALCDVLERIQCAVRWNPLTGAYSIVRLAVDDATFDVALAAAVGQKRKIADAEYQNAVRGEIPFGVTVLFHAIDLAAGAEETITNTATAWQTRTPYSVQVAGGVTGAEPGVYTPLWDDMPAIYDYTNTLTNSAALATRAAERASDYFRRRTGLTKRFFQAFTGLVSLVPTGICTGVAWRQDADGAFITEVSRSPWPGLKAPVDPDLWHKQAPHGSTSLQPPALGPTWPVAAQVDQVIILTGSGDVSPDGNGHYAANLVKPKNTSPLTFATKDSVLAVELNGITSLVGGAAYTARLVDYNNGSPVFVFNAAGSGGGGGISTGDSWVVPVSTTIAANISTGFQTVTPASMAGIFVGANLRIDRGAAHAETVTVTVVTSTTFEAGFANTHTGPGILVEAASTTAPGGVGSCYPAGLYDVTETGGTGNVYTFVDDVWLLDLNAGTPLDLLPIEPGWTYRCSELGSDSNDVPIYADFSVPSSLAIGISGYTDGFAVSGSPANFVLNFNKDGPSYSGVGNVDIIWAGFVGAPGLTFHCYGQTTGFTGTLAAAIAAGKNVANGLIQA